MSEARILAAFYNRRQGRFCSLLATEVTHRSGSSLTSTEGRSLIQRGFITREELTGVHTQCWAYSLTPKGEARVSAMVVLGTLPKTTFRLTAKPPEGKCA